MNCSRGKSVIDSFPYTKAKETSSFCIYMKIYAKGDVFLRKKFIILLMIAMLGGIAAGSQMLGERLYARVDENSEDKTGESESVGKPDTDTEGGSESGAVQEGAAAAGEGKEGISEPGTAPDGTVNPGETPDGTPGAQTAENSGISENETGAAETAGNAEKSGKGTQKAEGALVILDAGHGGFDPGKIGINGALEKDVNLVLSQKIKKHLEDMGYRVLMTRENEDALAGSKVEDLKTRVTLINENNPAIAVSIHQNSYSQENVHGAQVFYYTHSKGGEQAAKILQEAMLEVEPENHRQAKANDTYYLLKKTKGTTVIVECGFLSNQEEANLLVTEDYQEKMAAAVAKGIQEYVTSFTL